MRIGIPVEVKDNEHRVAMTPDGVHELARAGHEVRVEAGAGSGSSFDDDAFAEAGATIVDDADELWAWSELVLKVKEPDPSEYHRLRRGLVLFTYLHLAADERTTRAVLDSGVTAVAYETVTGAGGGLPLLNPMSEVAGRLATQVGANYLMRAAGGSGVLMGGIPGVRPARVTVIGGGTSGSEAAYVAAGMGAEVTILDISVDRLRLLDQRYPGMFRTLASNEREVARCVADSDLVIGAVLVPGAKSPTLVTSEMVARMRPGSVLVDIAIDQGGCFEDSRPTTHSDPVFTAHGATFYCVTNMPGSVPQTSTQGLTNVTLPYVQRLAGDGWRAAMRADAGLAAGLNAHEGVLTNTGIAEAHGFAEVVTPAEAIRD